MYRVFLVGLLGAAVSGCSMGSAPVMTGFNDTPNPPRVAKRATPRGAALGGPGNSDTRVAALSDNAPNGSYQTARKGALSGRDYSRTLLDPAAVMRAINEYRRERGLKPLRLNAELTAAAKAHSRDLAKWDRISHYGSDGSNPWDRVKRTGYQARLAAENVGTGQATFKEVFRGWKESEGHNKNLLLADADQMGIALVQDPNTEFKTFWTLVLGASM